ncbi:MAG: tRNA (adenosine(37)-N6)-dimethylallyltransferase MiaA [Anaerolineae bacterium]|nr:tRNA (adenosine(37)-N6)-dimethylallyltransferase MiaA [Thermoflexales bacterium]MDW8408126.1 tRNA (adenosine(37)-N6)-dimethylallyltransferase MiaA [Anaerolineae bacterium]
MRSRLIVIIGPTAAGKSARALALVDQLETGGEIVSADSRHVYKRMDIGTNKPTSLERSIVPHHLIDLREPDESFSLGEYVELARAAIEDVQRRGKVPVLVGGTGQYVRALLEGWQVPAIAPHPGVRQRWAHFAAERGPDALRRELEVRDPAALRTIDPRNIRRVIRALEVIEITGQRWSDLQRRVPTDLRTVEIIYIQPARPALYARADVRVRTMIQQGWLDETRALLTFLAERGITGEAVLRLPALSALGYRQLVAVVHEQMTLEDAIATIQRDTRRFIRAQDTWFKAITARALAQGARVVIEREMPQQDINATRALHPRAE